MRVVHISAYDNRGGAAVVCRRLISALRQKGIDATMLVMESRTEDKYVVSTTHTWLKKKLNFFRLAFEKVVFLCYQKSSEIRFQFSLANTGEDISNHPAVKKADIIHLHWINHGFLSLKSLKYIFSLKKPVVWTLHDMWPFTGGCHHSGDCENYTTQCGNCMYLRKPCPDDLSNRIVVKKSKITEGKNITIVACSKWLAGRASKSFLFRNLKVYDIPNPLDTSVYMPQDKVVARKNLGLDEKKKYILFGAENIRNYYKGFQYFIEALRLLKNRTFSFKDDTEILLLGRRANEIVSLIPFRAHDLGLILDDKKITDVYSAANVMVNSSIQENLPTMIMESFACGTPVVAFETGGIPEMIEHKKTGYIARYRSAEDLALGMEWCLNESDKGTIATNCREKVISDYSYQIVSGKYEKLYSELLKENRI